MYNPVINPTELITMVAIAVLFITPIFTISEVKEIL